jgi:hypothetical protein
MWTLPFILKVLLCAQGIKINKSSSGSTTGAPVSYATKGEIRAVCLYSKWCKSAHALWSDIGTLPRHANPLLCQKIPTHHQVVSYCCT